jgi:hypothetical protein
MRLFVATCCLGVAALLAAAPAAAQQPRTVDVRNDTVYVDGLPVSRAALPDSIDLSGPPRHYHFSGVATPIVEIDGHLFVVGTDLRPALAPDTAAATPGLAGGSSDVSFLPDARLASGDSLAADRSALGDLPDAHRAYLDSLRLHSRGLYDRLLREHRLESATRNLAYLIRQLPAGPERRAQVDTLRVLLRQAFDLKQTNRQLEIKQLRRQIVDLQLRLVRREAMRRTIIDRRLRQLLEADSSVSAARF